MGIRVATYAFARPVPYLFQQGVTETIQAPIRHGSTGALVAPTAAGSSVTITDPAGTEIVSGAAVAVSSSTAGYALTPPASGTLGEGWTVVWTLIIDGETYTYRQSAILCEFVPPNLISVIDVVGRFPELQHRVPQSQGDRGDGVGWQPQIDTAYYEFIQGLLDDARPIWLIREATGYRPWLLARALQLCIAAIPVVGESSWTQAAKDLFFELRGAKSAMRLQYSKDSPSRRRGGSPVNRLAPVGRPLW